MKVFSGTKVANRIVHSKFRQMKTFIITLIAMLIGTSVALAQQNSAVKVSNGKIYKVQNRTAVKSAHKGVVTESKSSDASANISTTQVTTNTKNSGTSSKLVRVPVRGKKISVAAKSALKEK
jgi:hypothetical protein